MDSALPGHIIDLMRDGVGPAAVRAKGERAVYGALVSTAASAHQRGWSYARWADLVMDPRNELARQAQLKNGKPRGRVRTEKFLTQAWDRATAWLKTAEKPFTKFEVEEEAARREELAMLAVADVERELSDSQRAVLAFVAQRAAKIGTLRVAVPRAMIQDQLGLGTTAARNALDRLCKKGYLELVEKGRPGGERTKRRRANVYTVAAELPVAVTSPIPETGLWGPLVPTSGAPLPTGSGAVALTSSAPTVENDRKECSVITLTYSQEGEITVRLPDATPREVIEALRSKSVDVVVDSSAGLGNVSSIFRQRAERPSNVRAASGEESS
jgi:hypothetical protein